MYNNYIRKAIRNLSYRHFNKKKEGKTMNSKPTLTIMCGVPGLGKDWQIEHNDYFINLRDNVVSRDKIRFGMIGENDDYFSREKQVFKEFVRQIASGLAEGKDMVANATHINEAGRSKLLNAIDKYGVEYNIVYFVLLGSVDTALRQNSMREGLANVPEEAIRRMAGSFTKPSFNEDERIKHIWIQYVKGEN